MLRAKNNQNNIQQKNSKVNIRIHITKSLQRRNMHNYMVMNLVEKKVMMITFKKSILMKQLLKILDSQNLQLIQNRYKVNKNIMNKKLKMIKPNLMRYQILTFLKA